MSFERPRTPEFSDIPIRYLYVKVARLRDIREEIEMEGVRWRVIEVNYGDHKEFYNADGTMARLTLTPVEQFDQSGEPLQFGHLTVSHAAFIRAEVEAMEWPDIIGDS